MADPYDPKKDFNPIELSIQAHGEGISSLENRVTALEQTLKDPKLLAKTLEDAVEESTRLKKLFSKVFCDMMKDDKEVTASIQDKINAMDRESAKVFWKKFGGKIGIGIWTLIVAGFSGWIVYMFLKK